MSGVPTKFRGRVFSCREISFLVVWSKKRSIYSVAPAGFFGNNLVDLVPAMPDGKEFEAG